ncbi:MAG: hypothetical protein ACUVS3_02205 [Thermodesulfobacteriota bacterium]
MKLLESHKDLLLRPRSVVFVGPFRESGPAFLNLLDHLRVLGFRRKILVVYPHVPEIEGFSTVKDLSMIKDFGCGG